MEKEKTRAELTKALGETAADRNKWQTAANEGLAREEIAKATIGKQRKEIDALKAEIKKQAQDFSKLQAEAMMQFNIQLKSQTDRYTAEMKDFEAGRKAMKVARAERDTYKDRLETEENLSQSLRDEKATLKKERDKYRDRGVWTTIWEKWFRR